MDRPLMNRPGPLAEFLQRDATTMPADITEYGKFASDPDAVLSVVGDGSTIMVGGFGSAGFPFTLRDALARKRLRDLTIIGNNGDFGPLTYAGGLRKLICSYPAGESAPAVIEKVNAGEIELQITPQGVLVEQLHSGAAGLGGVLTKTGLGAEFASRFDVVTVEGEQFVLAPPLRADVALVAAAVADSRGNLACRRASRNFNPLMAMAASYTVAEVEVIVGAGELDPDLVHIPGAFVDKVVPASR